MIDEREPQGLVWRPNSGRSAEGGAIDLPSSYARAEALARGTTLDPRNKHLPL